MSSILRTQRRERDRITGRRRPRRTVLCADGKVREAWQAQGSTGPRGARGPQRELPARQRLAAMPAAARRARGMFIMQRFAAWFGGVGGRRAA